MNVLFIHQAFPAQFGRLGLELAERYGWTCRFLAQDLSNCPTPSPAMMEKLQVYRIPVSAEYRAKVEVPWSQSYSRFLELALAVTEGARAIPGPTPDLVVAHDSLGPSLFLPELFRCPLVNYCEYYFAPSHSDISYRIDLPPAEPAPFYPRCINASALVSMTACAGAYTPTRWQRATFPARWHPKIEVHFDGIDAELYRRRPVGRSIGTMGIPEGTRVVTFVARGLESMRGFDRFMDVAGRIARERADVLFVVVGQDRSYYSWDKLHVERASFKEWVLSQGEVDRSRFVFIDHLEPPELAKLLSLSDLHVHLTVPFVLSWSLFNALACGCVVLASDVGPVREVIEPGVNGLMEPLFDTDRLAATAVRVLDDPAGFRPLAEAGRRLVEERYSLDVAVPALKDYFERMVS